MSVSTINIGLRVRDIEKTTEFVRALLGEPLATMEIPGETPTQEIRIVGSKERRIFFDLYSDSDPDKVEAEPLGIIQYCLGVDDVNAAYQRALGAGGTEMEVPTDVEVDPPDGAGEKVTTRVAHVRDPDGIVCEFVDSRWLEWL